MRRQILLLSLLGFCCGPATAADNSHNHAPKAPTNAGFEKLKTLVGTWVAADEQGNPTDQVVSVIKLTAGGSALEETLFPGQPHEMVSLYTPDGQDVVMTHYCMLGNQPRMKAATASFDDKLNFEFAGGTNLDPAKDKHMHAALLTFVDDDHLQVNAIGWEDGKPAQEMCHVMKLARQK